MSEKKRLATVIRPQIEPGRRVIAVSDIHGNLPFLKGVLEKARFSPEDVLVLVGDLFEKGFESLGVLRWLMELSRTLKDLLHHDTDSYVLRAGRSSDLILAKSN